MPTKTIVFVHGLFMTFHCWDAWADQYQALGYHCISIPWPGRDKPLQTLKQKPDLDFLAQLSFADVLNHHIDIIEKLPEKPIIIGHSLGGLFTQLLIQRNLGAAGIAIDSAPPKGIASTKWSFLRTNWPALNLLVPDSKAYTMSFEEFQYAFVNGLPISTQKAAYEQTVPESRRVWRGTLTDLAKIDFMKPHAPLLMIAGTNDHIIPAALNRVNYDRYSDKSSVTEFKEFAERTHYLLGQEGWQEIANYIDNWIKSQGI